MQTLTGVGVEHLCVNDQGVLSRQVRQLDALAVSQVGAQLFAVEVNGLDRGSNRVNEGGGTFLSVETDFNLEEKTSLSSEGQVQYGTSARA